MKSLVRPAVLILLASLCLSAAAQTGEWTWMGGSNKMTCVKNAGCFAPGSYGTLGVPAAGNVPGGRYRASSWTDSAGNFWLFGGLGFASTDGKLTGCGGTTDCNNSYELNDLWEYNPSTRKWAWMSGSMPVCTSDSCGGAFGVYGTLGAPAAANVAGSRYNAVGWTDAAGDLWLLGGNGYTSNQDDLLNDLWEFNPAIGEWAWMSGSDITWTIPPGNNFPGGVPGVYGSLGVAAAANVPGSRQSGVTWTDSSGNLWMYGGWGFDSTDDTNRIPWGDQGELNDLWEFSPSTHEWTWMGGVSVMPCTSGYWGVCGVAPVNGTLGIPAAENTPGGRDSEASWVDGSGNLWVFGGNGVDGAAGTVGYPNDLWEFNTTTQEWTWISGNNSFAGVAHNYYPGIYGTLGIPAAGNVPGSRTGAVTWMDARGRLWLFGGNGYDSIGYGGRLNDLWRFDPATREWTWMNGSSRIVCGSGSQCGHSGVYGTLGEPGPKNVPGSRFNPLSWTDSSGNFWLFGGSGCDSTPCSGGDLNDLWEYQPSDAPSPAAAPAFSEPAGAYTSAQTVTLSDVMPTASIFYTLDGTTPTPNSTPYTIPIQVGKTTEVKAIATATGFANSTVATATYTIHLPQTITFAPPTSPVTYGVKPMVLSATATSGLTVKFSVVSGPARVSGKTLTITGAGTVVIAANQAGSANYSAAAQVTQTVVVNQATLIVSANNKSMTYGGTVPALTHSIKGFVDGDTAATALTGAPNLSTTATSNSPVGSYAITAAAGTLAAANYTFQFVPGTLTVNKAKLIVSANSKSMTYGGTVPALTYSIKGFVDGDTAATAVTGAPNLSTTATSNSPVGSYAITAAAGTLAATNYTFQFVPGTLTINKAKLTVTANNLTMKKGATVPTLTYTMTGFVNGETQPTATTGQPALSTKATSKSAAGTYPIAIKAGTLAAANYTFTFVNGTLTVTN
ncbi:MAG: MBG domain-containing protein [Terracidiphilus sp.]